ncbi:MAG TPA: branched-chain amino acid ABC transporter permease [Candidatus Lustribacter sp.]
MKAHLLALAAIVAIGITIALGMHDPVALDLVFAVLLWAVLGQSWNWVSGYGGDVSFGHAIFFACGAYAAALATVSWHVSPWLAVPAAIVAAVALAWIVGYPTLGLRGHYFSIATIAVAAIVDAVVRTQPWLGRANGFQLPIANGFANLQFADKGPYVLTALALFAIVQLATIALGRSRLGYYLRALRANHEAAAALGIDERRWKLLAFSISAAFASLGGVLFAQYTLFVDPPSTLDISISVDMALVGVIGGLGTIWGPTVGAIVFVALAKYLALQLGGTGKGYDLILYGAIIVLIATLRPRGVVGTIIDRIRRRQAAVSTPSARGQVGRP